MATVYVQLVYTTLHSPKQGRKRDEKNDTTNFNATFWLQGDGFFWVEKVINLRLETRNKCRQISSHP